jgi:SAM-dependent methyltransferase
MFRTSAGAILDIPWVFRSLRGLIDPGQAGHLKRLLARVPHASVLDLGCGIGSHCAMTEAAYTGVDASPAYVAYARRHFGGPSRRFEVGDAFALGGGLGHHDVVALINVVHHFSDDEVRGCLAGLKAVTPRRLFLVDVALEEAGILFRRVFGPLDRGGHFRTRAAQRALVESCGWRVEWEDGYATPTGIYPHSVLVAASPEASG